tara:strand:- start:1035 stop:1178 length:144 start_codon:yes stop_codon:yes gene_type:complete
MGCSHYIIGRDYTGVDDYYGNYESHDIFRNLGSTGIEPEFFQSIGYL